MKSDSPEWDRLIDTLAAEDPLSKGGEGWDASATMRQFRMPAGAFPVGRSRSKSRMSVSPGMGAGQAGGDFSQEDYYLKGTE
ncbi:MAG: hypothetical protein A2075_03260 [Geobacteraceae bacterium GWC2_58_44]|nr:MAG: hypothetical protein A2075_03260 [Geobacteraceae bacterium GWC2_58_44]HBG05810.1 hypothetical protein [Geobacter sp.]